MTQPTWQGFLIHHSATTDSTGVDLEIYRNYHTLSHGWQDIGYHFVIESVMGIPLAIMGRPTNRPGAHCPGKNNSHIGICFAGNYVTQTPPPPILLCGAKLIASLCYLTSITPGPDTIEPHHKYRQTSCPGDLFPLTELILQTQLLLHP